MMYLIPHNASRRGRRVLILVVGVCVLVVGFTYLVIPHVFAGMVTALATPFWRASFSIESGALRSTPQLLEELESLRREHADYEVRLETIRAVERENSELKKILGRDMIISTTSAQIEDQGLLAAVLKRPPIQVYDELIVDVGSDDGVTSGDLVYAPGRVLVGKVSSVLGSSAHVLLFSSPGQQYEVMIGSHHIPATAVGRGGGQYEAQVARDISVTEGDFVEVPSLDDRPFATVTTVISDPTQPFKTILFAPTVNMYELRWVMVKKKTHD